MRTLEITLLITLAALPLWPLLRDGKPAWLLLLPAAILPAHWLLEGYRWQMVPAYLLAAATLAIGAYRLRRGVRAGERARWRRAAALIGGLLLLAVVAAPPVLLPVPDLPKPAGPYPVGTTVIPLVDDSRPEIYTADPNDHRRLMLQVWYPAEPDRGEPAPYIDQIDVGAPVLAANFNLPTFFLDHIRLARPNARRDAPPNQSSNPWPMVLFSHGLTGYRSQNTYQVEMLASHGYLVAAVDHTYAAGFTVLPENEVIVYDPARIFPSGNSNAPEAVPLMAQWADDLGFVVDTLEALNKNDRVFAGRIDTNRIALIGHSTGGGAVVRFCHDDPRCDAGIGLDAWLMPLPNEIVANPPQQPFLHLSTSQWLGEENRARGARLSSSAANTYWITIGGTGHYDFTDLSLLSPLTPYLGLTGELDGPYTLNMINETTLSFLEGTWSEGPLSGAPESVARYPEMKLEQHP